ncbi:DUF4489 domain-containing protein [Clostridium bowmanii]|uniref:DUF4489 domain-containing protein n=1 Tax=Clostridium bowmanii TaxID=132925 RepID=UPI001C0D6FD5|nr:DUF4489 domain-containing protein [Clostridium bowmanii]MBU3192058.1 DUF4489 domain-containing protein [Clostridium bowmanii]MCA1076241.1 DUF4489 domain-containing protein [Clostridium bowmanii]
MNSMSRPRENDDRSTCCKKEKEAEVILKCKTAYPLTILETTTTGSTFVLDPINLNLTNFRNPCIKLEFAANIVTVGTTVTLDFQIFKLCCNQISPTAVGPVWVYDKTISTGSESFSFIVCECDCDACPEECCTYSVVVTAVSTEVGTTVINNATLSALVAENKRQCC